jgi:hypothetical protein
VHTVSSPPQNEKLLTCKRFLLAVSYFDPFSIEDGKYNIEGIFDTKKILLLKCNYPLENECEETASIKGLVT